MEGFDWCDTGQTSSALDTIVERRGYPYRNITGGNDAITDTGAWGSGTAYKFRYYAHYIETNTFTYGDTFIFGMRINGLRDIPQDNTNIITLLDENRNITCRLELWKDGFIRAVGSAYGDMALIPNAKMGRGLEGYVEWKVYLHDTNGSWEIRWNGNTILTQTNVDTKYRGDTTGANRAQFISMNSTNTADEEGFRISDIYICDDAGSVNNDFLGPCRVLALHPDADGDDEDWTTSSGTDSYALVNETSPADDDSDYIEDSTTGNRSIFTYDDVPTGMGSNIKGVQLCTLARITDATSYDLKNTVKSGGTLYYDSAVTIDQQDYTDMEQQKWIMETDPDTGSAWTESGLNAVQAGVEVG